MPRETTSKKYIEAVGRRKTAIARVRLTPENKTSYRINGRELAVYFPIRELAETVTGAFASAAPQHFGVSAKVLGGGQTSQAEAIRHGIARALIKYDEALRKALKSKGYLKRDPRVKERRKFGLKKARKAAQWSKR